MEKSVNINLLNVFMVSNNLNHKSHVSCKTWVQILGWQVATLTLE